MNIPVECRSQVLKIICATQGHTLTSHQSGRQSEARINHTLHNMNTEGMGQFERDWARVNRARLPGQHQWAFAGAGSPGMIDITSSSGHASRRSR